MLLAERRADAIRLMAEDARDPQVAAGVGPPDVAVVSHVLRDLAPEQPARPLRNLLGWLRTGGMVAAHDALPTGRPVLGTALFES